MPQPARVRGVLCLGAPRLLRRLGASSDAPVVAVLLDPIPAALDAFGLGRIGLTPCLPVCRIWWDASHSAATG